MSVWNINYGSDLISSKSQSTYLNDSNNNNSVAQNVENVSSSYAKILAERISKVDEQFEDMQRNFENQQKSSSATSTYTRKKIMPDGSIMITTYEDGEIASQIKKRPHLVPTPDYSALADSSGNPAIKMKSQLNLLDLLMI